MATTQTVTSNHNQHASKKHTQEYQTCQTQWFDGYISLLDLFFLLLLGPNELGLCYLSNLLLEYLASTLASTRLEYLKIRFQ